MLIPETDLHLSDADLIRSYRDGDETALSTLIRRHLAPLYRFVYRMVGDGRLAEDLVQESFLKAWKYLPRFDVSKAFSTWLYSIAKNVSLDELRKKRPMIYRSDDEDAEDLIESIPDVQPLPPEILERKETAQELERLLSELAPASRSIVLLHDIEGLTFQEIADASDEPMNTVKSRYRRAIAFLRLRVLGAPTNR